LSTGKRDLDHQWPGRSDPAVRKAEEDGGCPCFEEVDMIGTPQSLKGGVDPSAVGRRAKTPGGGVDVMRAPYLRMRPGGDFSDAGKRIIMSYAVRRGAGLRELSSPGRRAIDLTIRGPH